jgi:hypothetical protein
MNHGIYICRLKGMLTIQTSQREVWEVLKRRSEELEIAGEDAGLGTTDKTTRVMNQTRGGKCQIVPNKSAMLSDKWDRGSKLLANRTYKPRPQGYHLQNTYLINCSEQEWNMDVFPTVPYKWAAYFNQYKLTVPGEYGTMRNCTYYLKTLIWYHVTHVHWRL